MYRRELLKFAGTGVAAAVTPAAGSALSAGSGTESEGSAGWMSVRAHGAKGDGATTDTPAINKAIESAARSGGGTVYFPAGVYLSYSIRLKSKVGLFLDHGAVILAGPTPLNGMTSGGYDSAEPQGAWEPYQDYGHNHWHNSLLWGEGLDDISISGPGMIWGKGLSRGWDPAKDVQRPDATKPGVGNKAIALKNCRNVLLRDFKILEGGWFGILATGVDNMTIDNLTIDTNRDGIDIDCCRNVRVSNCAVNSPWDDGICPKSSFALGYARPTENVTITNCYVTGGYALGAMIDGSWKPVDRGNHLPTGRIKMGTESNGGFRNIAISNCVFESCRGLAIETVDGALVEDITFTGITMRDLRSAPLFLRLGTRMRGPRDAKPGVLRRVMLSNITCQSSAMMPSIFAGVAGHPLEDIRIHDVIVQQAGGGDAEMAALMPEVKADAYPEPEMFGKLPATGIYARHVRGLDVSNVEIATSTPDARAAFWLKDVDGADFFRVRTPKEAPAFALRDVKSFRSFGSQGVEDTTLESVDERKI